MSAFTVTVSMPGCLPNTEPTECETLDDARTALIAELWITADRANLAPKHVEDQVIEANAVPSTGGCVMLDGYAHEIHPAS